MELRPGTSLLALSLLVAACGGDAEEETAPARAAETAAAEEAAPEVAEPRVRELPGGLVIETRTAGEGDGATVGDRVTVHLEGKVKESGEVFETTRTSGIPRTFTLGERGVIRAFELALTGARAGDELHLDVPAALAYGAEGFGRVPADADLEFSIQVVSVQ